MFQFHKKDFCPLCNQKAQKVSALTISSIVKKEYQKDLSSLEGFYFCNHPVCKTIYFKDQIIFNQDKLIKKVGLKEGISPEIICYCFNWTKERIIKELISNEKVDLISKIKKKRKKLGCNCERENPSGKCCLNNIKQTIDTLKLKFIF